MKKELQDYVWTHCLPKEFKEEVKYYYQHTDSGSYAEDMLESIFGKHNLTSDAEGEEYLCIERNKVQKLYDGLLSERNVVSISSPYGGTITARLYMLKDLFGSKCLPDDKADEKVDDKADENVPDENPSDIDSSEPNPAEPKFKVGDKVVIIANCKHQGEVAEIIHVDDDMAASYKLDIYDDGKWYTDADLEPYTEPKYHKGEKVYYNGYAYEVEGLVGKNRYALKGLNFDLDEDMIEPYTGPTPIGKEVNFPTKNELRNLSQNIADCDKQLDNILKDSFSKERRLNVATIIMAGMMANPNIIKSRGDIRAISDEWLASRTLELADALLAECEEGGKS